MNQPTLREVVVSIARCAATTVRLMATDRVGTGFVFADGSRPVVFRETVARERSTKEPVVLLVSFRLRFIGGNRAAHAVFRGPGPCGAA